MNMPLFCLRGENEGISSFRFAPLSSTDSLAISGSAEGSIRIWDLLSRRIKSSLFTGDNHGILETLPYYWANQVIVQSKVGVLQLWDIQTEQRLLSFETKALSFAQIKIMTENNQNNGNLENRNTSSPPLILAPLEKQGYIGLFDLREHITSSNNSNKNSVNANYSSRNQIRPALNLKSPSPENSTQQHIYHNITNYDSDKFENLSSDTNPESYKPYITSGMVQAFTPAPYHNNFTLLTAYEAASVALWDIRKPKFPVWCYFQVKHREPYQSIATHNNRIWLGSAIGNLFGVSISKAPNSAKLHITRHPPSYNKNSTLSHSWKSLYQSGEKIKGDSIDSDYKKASQHHSSDHPELDEEAINAGIGTLSLSPNGKYLVAGCWDCKTRVFETLNGELIGQFALHTLPVSAVDYSSSNNVFATASRDNKIAIWKL